MIIRLKVFEQTLSILDAKSVPRKGSKDYLVLQFMFSSDWKDLNKLCYLQKGEVSQPIDVVDDIVEVPEWFTQQDSFDVTLFGKSGNQEVPTNVVPLRLEKSNTLWEQGAPEPQPSWLAKVIELNNHPPVPGENGYWLLFAQHINTLSVDDTTAQGGQNSSIRRAVQHGGKLWRCLQAHTAQTGWEPENAASLWAQICETHDGTKYDPIPYDGNMALESGKYYTQSGMTYLCSRDTVNPVYNALSELVDIYVEVVNG